MTKRDKAILYTLACALMLVGVFQIAQKVQYGHVTACQAAIVDQFVKAAGPRAEAADAKDQAEADMASALIDPKATDAEKKAKFGAWVTAVEDLVTTKLKHPLPPPPTSVCGEA